MMYSKKEKRLNCIFKHIYYRYHGEAMSSFLGENVKERAYILEREEGHNGQINNKDTNQVGLCMKLVIGLCNGEFIFII